eukprot:TRINITY_DN18738_c0_g2_i1.p1 TRINITY_DN18738_c0_g2~~TRINITY_DN18738_c0_g2_i1.p1  ORF type:complete len:173 (-),score=1.54 TRINITY_DN18738_c0_g2_i1:39-557(-)
MQILFYTENYRFGIEFCKNQYYASYIAYGVLFDTTNINRILYIFFSKFTRMIFALWIFLKILCVVKTTRKQNNENPFWNGPVIKQHNTGFRHFGSVFVTQISAFFKPKKYWFIVVYLKCWFQNGLFVKELVFVLGFSKKVVVLVPVYQNWFHRNKPTSDVTYLFATLTKDGV